MAAVACLLPLGAGGQTDTTAPAIPGVVAGGTRVQRLLTSDPELGGEGAVGAPDGSLLFAHQDANRILKIDISGSMSTYLEQTNRIIGLGFDPDGRLIGVGGRDGGSRSDEMTNYPAVEVLSPRRQVLVDIFEGKRFRTIHDIAIDRKGGIYFTHGGDDWPPPEGRPHGVFYRTPDGRVLKVGQPADRPNATVLSPDDKVLYVANQRRDADGHVMACDVQADGRLGPQRIFVRAPHADGLAVDAVGRLYVATETGVTVFSPEGRQLGIIPMAVRPSNLAFAGPGRKTLFVVGRGGAFSIAMLAVGVRGRAK